MNALSNLSATSAPTPSTPAPAPSSPPETPAGPSDFEFSYNAQDEVVLAPRTQTVHGVTVGTTLTIEKAHLGDRLAPNSQGQYVFDSSDVASQTAAISFAAVARTIDVFEGALGQPIAWAFPGSLSVHPDNGPDFNAYYMRSGHSVNFFHGLDPKTGQTIMSGASGEVVSHEVGHAILDGLRPAYMKSWTPDVGAFHESFGDVVAMLMSLQDDATVQRVVAQTGGDLSKPSCLADIGEQLGIGINDKAGGDVTGGNYVRTARNDFKYRDPRLGTEVHDLSRLWTGTFYDVLSGIQARNMAAGMDAASALRATGGEGLKLVANLLKEAPQADFTFPDMARALLTSDQKYDHGANHDLLAQVLGGRGLLSTASMNAAPRGEVRDVDVPLTGPGDYGQFQGALVRTTVESDGSRAANTTITHRVRENLAGLIAAGRIRYTDPGQKVRDADRFDAKGQPYIGIVRWEDGQMIIERNPVLA